jgi:hypothetical protein
MIVGALIGAALVHWRRAAGLSPAAVMVAVAALAGALRASVAPMTGAVTTGVHSLRSGRPADMLSTQVGVHNTADSRE